MFSLLYNNHLNNSIKETFMKILTLIITISAFSNSAHAKVRNGDEYVLKKHVQNIKEIFNHNHLLIDGVKVSKFFELLDDKENEKHECQVGFYKNSQSFLADYLPGTRFEVLNTKRNTDFDIIIFPFDYDYKGTISLNLKELGKDTDEITNVFCITRQWYGNKNIALRNAADTEEVMRSLEHLFEAQQ